MNIVKFLRAPILKNIYERLILDAYIKASSKASSPVFKGLEAVTRRCSVRKVVLKILEKSQENNCVRVSFLIKLQASGLELC